MNLLETFNNFLSKQIIEIIQDADDSTHSQVIPALGKRLNLTLITR